MRVIRSQYFVSRNIRLNLIKQVDLLVIRSQYFFSPNISLKREIRWERDAFKGLKYRVT